MSPFAGMRWNWPVLASAASIVGCAVPAAANQYLTETQSLQIIFGADVAVRHETRSLSEEQRKQLESSSSLRFRESSYDFSIVEHEGKLAGYALILEETGKSEPITFMVGMTPEGKVLDVAIMIFRESRGWEVKEPRFLHQFHNKRVSDPIQIDRDLINYSGATLSSKAIARGVKRALLLQKEFYSATQADEEGTSPKPLLFSPADSTRAMRQLGSLGLYRQARYRMGTISEIRVWASSASDSEAAFAAGFSEISRLDRVFSNYRDDSELAIVNAEASARPVRVSSDFWRLTKAAVRSWKISNGTFDITVGPLVKAWGFHDGKPRIPTPAELAEARGKVDSDGLELVPGRRAIRFRKAGMELDFGGLAKGYAAERATQLALKAGAVSVLVNMGGSSLCAAANGERISEQADLSVHEEEQHRADAEFLRWPVVMQSRSPSGVHPYYWMLPAGWVLSSSGSSEQSFTAPDGEILSHIIDPRTGMPLQGPCGASVVTRSGIKGEVLTKPLLLGIRSTS